MPDGPVAVHDDSAYVAMQPAICTDVLCGSNVEQDNGAQLLMAAGEGQLAAAPGATLAPQQHCVQPLLRLLYAG